MIGKEIADAIWPIAAIVGALAGLFGLLLWLRCRIRAAAKNEERLEAQSSAQEDKSDARVEIAEAKAHTYARWLARRKRKRGLPHDEDRELPSS